MKIVLAIACALALFTSAAAAAAAAAAASGAPSFAGDYRLTGGPDVVGELTLKPDGRFQYELGAGALDERSEGRWIESNGQIRLYTDPPPKPATFAAGSHAAMSEGSLKLLVTWPDGNGIAGVDFTIGFDSGAPAVGYTQDYGWTMSRDEHRIPRWVELMEPIHGVVSPRFAIDVSAGNSLTFVLTPNDLGVVDFNGTLVDRANESLVMHQRLGDLTFERSDRDR